MEGEDRGRERRVKSGGEGRGKGCVMAVGGWTPLYLLDIYDTAQ